MRAVFDDQARTWVHIDPETGELLQFSNGALRTYRWLFNALHSLDFPWLLAYRPLLGVIVWLLAPAVALGYGAGN